MLKYHLTTKRKKSQKNVTSAVQKLRNLRCKCEKLLTPTYTVCTRNKMDYFQQRYLILKKHFFSMNSLPLKQNFKRFQLFWFSEYGVPGEVHALPFQNHGHRPLSAIKKQIYAVYFLYFTHECNAMVIIMWLWCTSVLHFTTSLLIYYTRPQVKLYHCFNWPHTNLSPSVLNYYFYTYQLFYE